MVMVFLHNANHSDLLYDQLGFGNNIDDLLFSHEDNEDRGENHEFFHPL